MPQDDGPQRGAWVPPPQHFAPPPRPPADTAPPAGTLHGTPRRPGPGRLRTLAIGGAVVALLIVAAVAATSADPERPGPLFVAQPPPPPRPPLPREEPAPTAGSTPPATTPVRDVRPEAGTTVVTGRSPARPSPTAPEPPAALPVPGREVGLASLEDPSLRLRHRDYIARLDPVGPASPALDRADSRFTVRSSRTATCLSFESFNYPGYFLRARGPALRLERADDSPAAATFCPIPAPAGGFILQSGGDPVRYVTEKDSVLTLDRVAPARAKVFITRPPL